MFFFVKFFKCKIRLDSWVIISLNIIYFKFKILLIIFILFLKLKVAYFYSTKFLIKFIHKRYQYISNIDDEFLNLFNLKLILYFWHLHQFLISKNYNFFIFILLNRNNKFRTFWTWNSSKLINMKSLNKQIFIMFGIIKFEQWLSIWIFNRCKFCHLIRFKLLLIGLILFLYF